MARRLSNLLLASALAPALAALPLACRSKPEGPPDTGVAERERTILEHVREIAGRMRDARFHAEFLAELATVEAGLQTPEGAAAARELLAEAVERAKKISSAEDREHAAERIATAHAATGQVDTALELAAAIRPPEARSDVLAAIAAIAAKGGDFARAGAIAEKIPSEAQKGDAYVAAARAAGAAEAWDAALELTKRPPRPEHRAEAQAALARAYLAAKRPKDAQKVIDAIDSGHWKGDAQAALVAWYYGQGDRAKAEKLSRAIESSWIQARSYAELATLADEAGRTSEAEKLLEKATSIADGIHDQTMRSSAYEDVAVRGLAKGRVTEALELAKRCPSNDARHRIWARVAGELARGRKYAEAEETARKITSDPIATTDAFAAIAAAYADHDNDERALEAITNIPTLSLRIPPLAKAIASSQKGQRAVTSLVLVHLATALEAAPPKKG